MKVKFYNGESSNIPKPSMLPRKHMMHGSSEYLTWHSMKQRCLNKKNKNYSNYGGRGISICERWLYFEFFYEDMGARPMDHEIDRIDNNSGYFKENCRWVARKINNFNKRSKNKTHLPRGVHKFKDKFKTSISIDNKSYHIGVFDTIIECKNAYDLVCKEWYGFSVNF